MTMTWKITNTVVKYRQLHGLLFNMQNDFIEIQTWDIGILLRGLSITKQIFFIAVQCENDVFDKGKEFQPAFSHQIFGQK